MGGVRFQAGLSLALFLAALVPRIFFVLEWNDAGLSSLPVVDAATFDSAARGLLDGSWPGPRVFWQAPLYPIFLSGVYQTVGPSWEVVWSAQAILGAVSSVLTFWVARRWLGSGGAVAAFVLVALSGPLLYFEGQLLRTTLATFLFLCWFWMQLRAFESRRWWDWVVAGFVLGLTAVCRENALLLIPVAFVLGLSKVRTAGLDWRTPVAGLLASILVVLPCTIRNAVYGDSFVLVSSSGGINFYIGNNPSSGETVSIRPGRVWEDLTAKPRREAKILDPGARSNYFYRESLRWGTEDPAAFFANTGRKALGLLSAHELKRNQDIYDARSQSRVLSLLLWRVGSFGFPFGILGPLSLLGLFFLVRNTRSVPRHRLFVITVVLLYCAGIVAYFPASRYRVPLLPLLSILSVLGVCEGWFLIREREFGRLVVPAAVVILGGFLVNGGWVVSKDDPVDQAYIRGMALVGMQRLEEAGEQLRLAVERDPTHAEAWTNLAAVHGMLGRNAEAVVSAEHALEADDTYAKAWLNLALARLQMKEPSAAMAALRRAIELQPDLMEARRLLAGSLQGSPSEAERMLLEGLELDRSDLPTWMMLGGMRARSANWSGAIDAFRGAVGADPRSVDAWNNLGVVFARAGDLEQAADAFGRALVLDPRNARTLDNQKRYLPDRGSSSR